MNFATISVQVSAINIRVSKRDESELSVYVYLVFGRCCSFTELYKIHFPTNQPTRLHGIEAHFNFTLLADTKPIFVIVVILDY